MEHIIIRYGVIAIFLGAGIEGEPFALAGGVLAQRHWISPVAAVLASIGGPLLVNQMWFHFSRHYRQSRLMQRIRDRPVFERSLELINRHPVRFVLLFRFAYGVRAVAAAAIGASRLSRRVFMAANLVGAIIWGIVFTALGGLLGPAVEAAEARYGSSIALGTICLSAAALAVALRTDK